MWPSLSYTYYHPFHSTTPTSDRDLKSWFLMTPWPILLLRHYPSLISTLQCPDSLFTSSIEDSDVPPCSAESAEELELFNRIRSDNVKNIWKLKAWDGENSLLHQYKNCPHVLRSMIMDPASDDSMGYLNCCDPSWWKEMDLAGVCPCWICSKSYSTRPSGSAPESYPNTQELLIEGYKWLEKIYPRRYEELAGLIEAGNYFESVTNHIKASKEEMESVPTEPPPEVETVYDELEREALEQYRASDTSITVVPILEVLSPEQETRLQDLEREALEQYDQTCGDDLERQELPEAPPEETPEEKSQEVPEEISEPLQKELEPQTEPALETNEAPVKTKQDEDLKEPVDYKMEREKKYSRLRMMGSYFEFTEPEPPAKVAKLSRDVKTHGNGLELDQGGPPKKVSKKQKRKKSPTRHQGSSNEELKSLILRLKVKVLNYIRNVDLRLGPESQLDKNKTEKQAVKQLLYNGTIPKPYYELVKIDNINDLETLKNYIKEHGLNTRRFLHEVYKRIRVEFMESTRHHQVVVAKLTNHEKRKVRQMIERSLQLSDKAVALRKVGKKADALKRDVTATMELIHRTMEVVFTIRRMTKEAQKELDIIKNPISNDPLRLSIAYLKSIRKPGYLMDHIYSQLRTSCLLKVAFLKYKRNYNVMGESNLHDLLRKSVGGYMAGQEVLYNQLIAPLFTLSKIGSLMEMRRHAQMSESVFLLLGQELHIERYERARYLKSIWPKEWWDLVINGDVEDVVSGLFSDPRIDGFLQAFFDSPTADDKDFLGEQMGEGDTTSPSVGCGSHCSLQ